MKYVQNYCGHKSWDETTWTREKELQEGHEGGYWEIGSDDGR
jgi:hypothetical protein